MKKLVLMLPLLGGALAANPALAQVSAAGQRTQDRTITGQVTDDAGNGLPGVTVLVRGGSRGTTTGSDGSFSLSVPLTAERLVFSYVGYEAQEISIGDRTTFNIKLTASTGLNEVVVVGYGTQARRELTGSVATITGKEIATTPVQSFDQALQGRATGVQITTPNGVLNNPPVVRIRGANSIALSSSPLYVIDGIPTYSGNNSAVGSVPNNPLANIAPEDIENIEVLKDASATAIYGSRANGGVILVTTKRGKRGQARLSYDTWVGVSKPVRLYDVLNAADYVAIKNEAVRNLNENRRIAIGTLGTNVEGFGVNSAVAADTRWYDIIYRTGFSQNHNLNFSGGTDKTTYLASVGYTNQHGMLVRNDFRRYSTRLNVEHKLFDRLTLSARVSYANSLNSSPNSGSVGDGAFGTAGLGRLPLVLPPNVSPYLPDGTYNAGVAVGTAGLGPGPNINPLTGTPLLVGYYNPVVDLENNYFTSESNSLQGALAADLELVKGLHLRTQYGIDNLNFEDKAYYTSLAGDAFQQGQAIDYFRTNKRWNWQNTAQYDLSAGEHNFSLLAGNEQQYTDVQRWGASRTGVADPFFTTYQGNYLNITAAGNAQGANYLASFFGRFTYNYGHKYLFTATGRRDGYSAWYNKFGNFYGLSAGYIVSEEGFWKNSGIAKAFDFLKFSGSYGTTGNNQGIFDYVSLPLYGSYLYGSASTFYLAQSLNPNIAWEVSHKTDASIAFGFLQSRLTGDVTYYHNLVDGLILDVPQAPSRGIPSTAGPGTLGNSIPANIGSMLNQGFEVNLRFDVLQNKAFNWTISGNLTTLDNKVLTLLDDSQRIPGSTSSLETANYTTVNRSIGSILAVQNMGVNPDNGQRMLRKADGTVVQYNHQGTVGGTGWTVVSTGANTSAPTQLVDGVYYGPVLPTFYGGLDNTFRFKGVDLGIFFQYSGGNYIYNGTKAGLHDQRFWNNNVDIKNHWTSENRNAEFPRVVYSDNVSNGSTIVMSQNVEKGDFIRLRNVSLGYTFPTTMLNSVKLSTARVYVQIQNALLFTKYSGIDPEISVNGSSNVAPGVDRNSVGQARTFTAGLNVSF